MDIVIYVFAAIGWFFIVVVFVLGLIEIIKRLR